MASLGFFLPAYYPKASEEVIKNIRSFYPDSTFVVASDAGPNHCELSREYNVHFQYYPKNLGASIMPHGYKKEAVMEWLRRFYIACLLTKETHIFWAEDDIALLRQIEVKDEWEIYAHDTTNYVPEGLLKFCEEVSGKYPSRPFYGAGGGTIYKVSTYIENYFKIVSIFDQIFEQVQEQYPTFGWYDCFMTIVYFMCGKEYTVNPGIFEIKPMNKNFDLESLDKSKYSIVHLYKNHYPDEYKEFTWLPN